MTPTLHTLRASLHSAGVQAEELREIHSEPGRTSDVVEGIALELQQCAEWLDEEIAALKRYGVDA